MNRALSVLALMMMTASVSRAAPTKWKVTNVSLTPDSEQSRTLTATVNDSIHPRAIEVSASVTLTSVREYFVSGDKLAIMGQAGRAEEVVILDLVARRKIDRFYCYFPMRLSEQWIVYVEFYPSLGADVPIDVVLLYDLTKSPIDNRLTTVLGERIPVPTKKSVLIEAVEFAKPRRVGCQSHGYPSRLPAFLRASLLPNPGSSAS